MGDHGSVKSRTFLSELVLCSSLVWLPSSWNFAKLKNWKLKNLPFWISRNCLSEVFLVQEACHLCHLFCYHVFCFRASFVISNISLILKGQKILFLSFLVRLGETFLESYLLLIGLFFLDGRHTNKMLIKVHLLPNNYFELKSIVLNHI